MDANGRADHICVDGAEETRLATSKLAIQHCVGARVVQLQGHADGEGPTQWRCGPRSLASVVRPHTIVAILDVQSDGVNETAFGATVILTEESEVP